VPLSQLAAIAAQFERAQERLHRVVAAVPPQRWAVRADPARWSVAECVAHLNLTGRRYVPLLQDALGEARALGEGAPQRYRRDFAGWLMSFVVGPMPRVGRGALGKARTIAAFVPSGELPRETVLSEFDRLQAEQIALTRSAEGLPLQRVRITSPFNARLRYNAYAAFVLLPRHQERHINQAQWVWS
jgi:hypothetical protein